MDEKTIKLLGAALQPSTLADICAQIRAAQGDSTGIDCDELNELFWTLFRELADSQGLAEAGKQVDCADDGRS